MVVVRFSLNFSPLCSLCGEENTSSRASLRRRGMLLVLRRKACHITARLLACMVVVAAITCGGHAMPLDHARAGLTEPRRVSSLHLTLDASCLVAALPLIILVPFLLFVLSPTTPLLLDQILFTCPLFRPPRNAAR